MLKWITGGGGGGGDTLGPKHSASTQSLSALDEPQALNDALRAMDLLMDDKIDAAEKHLENGASNYHKLAGGVISFLRASLGFEKDAMLEASNRLAEAETAAEAARKRAMKENHHHGRLPPGLEYQVCVAEAQLMAAVVGILSESVVDTMKSFYRLRTAYKSLESVHNTIISLGLNLESPPPTASVRTKSAPSSIRSSKAPAAPSVASSKHSKLSLKKVKHDSKAPSPSNSDEALSDESSGSTPGLEMAGNGAAMSRTLTQINRNILETFAVSGCLVCFGLLQLLLGLVPPSLGRIMSVVGFRGDREKGLDLLWQATKADNVHGAIATMTILQYYGNTVQFSDITPANTSFTEIQTRTAAILHSVRTRYPNSPLWILEEARMEAVYGSVEKAVDTLGKTYDCEMRQVEALILFEKCINSMFLHRYTQVSDDFIRLTNLNKWSHALYYYFSAACHIELYRASKELDPAAAEAYAKTAEEILEKVPSFMGKKRFMAQSLPLETFADRKIKKWRARSEALGCRLVDGVGVSPIEEMIYVWNGYKRMDETNFEISMKALEYGEETEKDADEIAMRRFLKSVVLRRRGKLVEADDLLEKVVGLKKEELVVGRKANEAQYVDVWFVPASMYEKAVAVWMKGGHAEREVIKGWLEKAAGWGSYELDTRIGMKIQTALNNISR